ncbi:MAG TPA: hypothetical protein VFQ39_03840 [Longimicrobium sp.]|nr:hypothetical protein [Longimicrobium sp.]
MTTQTTERDVFGAPFYQVRTPALRPTRPGQPGSFVNGARLVYRDLRKLGAPGGRVFHSDLLGGRDAVRDALGIGTGLPTPETPGSVRGRLARITPEVGRRAGFEFAVVLTAHSYSAQRRFQVVAPVVDLAELLYEDESVEDFDPEPGDILPGTHRWCSVFPHDWATPLIDTIRLVTLSEAWTQSKRRERWLPGQLRVLGIGIDAETLAAVEGAIAERFGLRPRSGTADS